MQYIGTLLHLTQLLVINVSNTSPQVSLYYKFVFVHNLGNVFKHIFIGQRYWCSSTFISPIFTRYRLCAICNDNEDVCPSGPLSIGATEPALSRGIEHDAHGWYAHTNRMRLHFPYYWSKMFLMVEQVTDEPWYLILNYCNEIMSIHERFCEIDPILTRITH